MIEDIVGPEATHHSVAHGLVGARVLLGLDIGVEMHQSEEDAHALLGHGHARQNVFTHGRSELLIVEDQKRIRIGIDRRMKAKNRMDHVDREKDRSVATANQRDDHGSPVAGHDGDRTDHPVRDETGYDQSSDEELHASIRNG